MTDPLPDPKEKGEKKRVVLQVAALLTHELVTVFWPLITRLTSDCCDTCPHLLVCTQTVH